MLPPLRERFVEPDVALVGDQFRLQVGGLRDARQCVAQGGREPEMVELRRAQVERKAARLRERPVDDRNAARDPFPERFRCAPHQRLQALVRHAQRVFGMLAHGDHLGEQDDAADGAAFGAPGMRFPVHPVGRAVGARERIFFCLLDRAGEAALVYRLPALRQVGEDLIVAQAGDVLLAEVVVGEPAAAVGEVAHVAVEAAQPYGVRVDVIFADTLPPAVKRAMLKDARLASLV